MEKIIYDVGANNGDNIPYYLLRADKVVAVEANPALCGAIESKYANEIRRGRLVLESCVVTTDAAENEVIFHLHNTYHVLSQLPPPPVQDLSKFTRIKLPAKPIRDLIQKHGNPYYLKLDVEHYDVPLLKSIFAHGVHPPFISAEAHSLEVFLTLVREGGYKAFKLVDGPTVSTTYADRLLAPNVRYSFPFHSAGPFGDDLDGYWSTVDHFFRLLAFEGLGHKDIHATKLRDPDCSAEPRVVNYLDYLLTQQELAIYLKKLSGDDDSLFCLNELVDRDTLVSLIRHRAKRWLRSLIGN